MSRLFGPLSETMSSVSWRDCALAGDHTAGAETALAAVNAVIDLRNSRRFMELSQGVLPWFRKPRATRRHADAAGSGRGHGHKPCGAAGIVPARWLVVPLYFALR